MAGILQGLAAGFAIALLGLFEGLYIFSDLPIWRYCKRVQITGFFELFVYGAVVHVVVYELCLRSTSTLDDT